MCRQAAGLSLKPEEKKLLLAALGGIASVDALVMVQPFLDDSTLQKEAASATLDIAAKVLEGPNASPSAVKLVAPIEQVVKLAASPELTTRAQKLLESAKGKAK